jgi:hypothetical protein
MAVAGNNGDAERRQIARILQSETFRNADSQRRLLAYLAEKTISGEADQLKEYTVGVEAFGKPPGYDPQHDASVRIQAGKLRQKLEEYYRSEGCDDPIVVSFPKGRFRLIFAPAAKPAVEPPATLYRTWQRVAIALAIALCGALSLLAYGLLTRKPTLTQEQKAIWGPLIRGKRPIILSLGAPLFVKTPLGFFRSPTANRWEEVLKAPEFGWMRAQMESGDATPVNIYTGLGDALSAVQIARLLTAAGCDLIPKRSVAVSWEDLTNHNVVFLGPPKYTLQLNEIPVRMDLVMEGSSIRNLRPGRGEPAELRGNWPERAPYVVEDYALISRVPGLHGRGEYLILSASSTEGTAAAATFVTDPGFVRDLVSRLRDSSGNLPRYFQAVIHARFRAMVPVEISYRFHHVLEALPTRAGSAAAGR